MPTMPKREAARRLAAIRRELDEIERGLTAQTQDQDHRAKIAAAMREKWASPEWRDRRSRRAS